MRKIDNFFTELPGYNCFGCAPQNPIGLKLDFLFDEESREIVTQLKDTKHFHGFPGVLHGGIQATLLDECGFWLIVDQMKKFAFTTHMQLEYKNVLMVPDKITIRAKLIDQDGKIAQIYGKILNGKGDIATEGTLTFYLAGRKMWEKMSGQKEVPELFQPYFES